MDSGPGLRTACPDAGLDLTPKLDTRKFKISSPAAMRPIDVKAQYTIVAERACRQSGVLSVGYGMLTSIVFVTENSGRGGPNG